MISLTHRPRPEHVQYILDNLRQPDRFEFSCLGVTDPSTCELAKHVGASDDSYLFSLGGEPVFLWGVVRSGSSSHLWGFGTEKTRRIIPSATRWGKGRWLPNYFKHGGKRIEVRVPLKSQNSISWLRSLGMKAECWHIEDHATNGEPMVQLAYTTREYTRDYVLPKTTAGLRSCSDTSAV